MAGTTSFYGWSYPTSTDYVKDGASNIQSLAQNVDTRLGLSYITSASGTNAAAITLDNIFTATYDTYRIVLNVACRSATAYLRARTRVGGVNATTGYVSRSLWGNLLTANTLYQDYDQAGDGFSLGPGGAQPDSSWGIITFDIANPYVAKHTYVTGHSAAARYTIAYYMTTFGGVLINTTSYTGLYIYANTGNLDYRVVVYGYRSS